ncbi:MAG: bifunctional alpha,alpha-trehalose-phosphate synthase (UDP-forming)/trehalose-phosphatase [Planctomycetota bacterium]
MSSAFSGEDDRLILVSNRLPVAFRQADGDEPEMHVTAGGLATGLMRPHRDRNGLWIGWPGMVTEGDELPRSTVESLRAQSMRGVPLSAHEHEHYYNRLSNRCLWPLFHYCTDRVEFDEESWRVYSEVNRKFADAVLAEARPGDLVFVHDFHLALVPAMLREAMPSLRIGFFLHIPFPSSELFRILPCREEFLRGLLGADMLGFHTLDYARHFRSTVKRVLGQSVGASAVDGGNRRTRLLVEPLGISPEEWHGPESNEGVLPEYHDLIRLAEGRRIILGVDRLDYTKGIPARLQAYQELLRAQPHLVDELLLIQIAVPSRVEVDSYRDLKREVDRLAGEINSEFGRPGRQPLHYQFRSVPREQLKALYRVADIALVTPIRDGLNLVAKEFVASRERDDGVLLIGEFTGAASELTEAVQVNPFSKDSIVAALRQALDMSPEEQAARMAPMRERVRRRSVQVWVERCLEAIRSTGEDPAPPLLAGVERARLVRRWLAAPSRTLLLDYDGTLREFTERPEDAAPPAALLELLTELASTEGTEVWIVSGRARLDLERWLGSLPVGLIAEHGAWMRPPDEREFRPCLRLPDEGWQGPIIELMQPFCERVPGSLVESKPVSIAWHYRPAEPALAVWQAEELGAQLDERVASMPLEVLRGDHLLEVRPAGVDKGSAVLRALPALSGEAVDDGAMFLLVAGDDRTDEDLFKRLPQSTASVLIGRRESAARWRLDDPQELRALLRAFRDASPTTPPRAAVG